MIVQPQVIGQNDYGYELPFTLEDGNGNAVDLTGASLVINVQDSQDATGDLLFGGAMTVDTAVSGICHYTVASGNFPNPGTFLAQIVAKHEQARELIADGQVEVEQKNLIVDSSNYGIDILVQYLLSAYTGSLNFPLGIAWGEIGTGSTTPTTADTALNTPSKREPVSYAADNGFNTAQLQFFFPDTTLANTTYTECGSFIGGTSTIGSGNMFNHALFATPYSKSSGTDTTLEIDISIT